MNEFYKKTELEVMKLLDVTEKGLSDKEVTNHRIKYGYNELEEKDKKSGLQIFFEQF